MSCSKQETQFVVVVFVELFFDDICRLSSWGKGFVVLEGGVACEVSETVVVVFRTICTERRDRWGGGVLLRER